MARTPTYHTWAMMLQRCGNPKAADFYRYGARGISVCASWRNDDGFARFLADMGVRPVGATLDRIDNTRGYEPGNCRWASRRQQSENRRCTHWVRINGESMTLTSWARVIGISRAALRDRLRRGLPDSELILPSRQRPGRHKALPAARHPREAA